MFTQVNGQNRTKNATFSALTGNLLNWQATGMNSVLNINCHDNYIAFSGDKFKVYTNPYTFSDFENLKLCSALNDTTIYFIVANPNNNTLTFTTESSDDLVILESSIQVNTNTNGNGFAYSLFLEPQNIGTSMITITVADTLGVQNSVEFLFNVEFSNTTDFLDCGDDVVICSGVYNFNPPELINPCGVSIFQINGDVSGTYLDPGIYQYSFESTLLDTQNGYCEYYVIAEECLSVEEMSVFNSVNLFPNPTQNQLTIHIDSYSPNQDLQYQLFDNWGRKIEDGIIDSTQVTIDTSDLADGIYCIKLIDKNTMSNRTLLFVKV